jgi:transposase
MPKPPFSDPKVQTLRQLGSLHPRPQAVADELFAAGEFFDARDLVQVKYEMLRRVDHDGRSISAAAAAFGFSRPSFYQAQAAFRSGGVAGLLPRKRGPKEARKLRGNVLAFLQEARQAEPGLRIADLARRLRARFDLVVHPRTIERALVRAEKKRQPPG